MAKDKPKFSFEISLSVLNHLGRHLYRSFATVLGEAISNSWDADAKNVWIYVDREKNSFFIKDDGVGMSAEDFQNKFLKIGYSKRKEGSTASVSGRPFIGRKGIGKLALLSCADKITVITKTAGAEYVGGVIDNSGLDAAITKDLTPEEYPLGDVNVSIFDAYKDGHDHGTIIYFENTKDGIKNSADFLKKTIALYFRFALLDDSFNIIMDGETISHKHLHELAEKTEFLWKINEMVDPYVSDELAALKESKNLTVEGDMKGFVASVQRPRDLKVITTTEKASVDLFVNGRLREKDILKHIPTARVVESYLYGQIHLDSLDDDIDRFTSSREGIVADDPKFKEFLENFRSKVIGVILEDWDVWRRKHNKDGDAENDNVGLKERRAEELYNAVSGEYSLPDDSEQKKKVEGWVNSLSGDATYNFASYAECFISENLIRKLIEEKGIALPQDAQDEITRWQGVEAGRKQSGNLNIDIRQGNNPLSYLDMDMLSKAVDPAGQQNCLPNDAKQYKPIRDALMHAALLTGEAKLKLTTVYDNIKARIRTLLS